MSDVPIAILIGIGALAILGGRSTPREPTLRERAIEAQRIAALAARQARELTARWSAEQRRSISGVSRD